MQLRTEKMLNTCPEHPDIAFILRTGEPLEVKYPDEISDEIEYIKDEMRFERQREERCERKHEWP